MPHPASPQLPDRVRLNHLNRLAERVLRSVEVGYPGLIVEQEFQMTRRYAELLMRETPHLATSAQAHWIVGPTGADRVICAALFRRHGPHREVAKRFLPLWSNEHADLPAQASELWTALQSDGVGQFLDLVAPYAPTAWSRATPFREAAPTTAARVSRPKTP